MMISLNPIVSRSKSKWCKPQKVKKSALNLQLQTVQILTDYVQMLILCLSYFITTVLVLYLTPYFLFQVTSHPKKLMLPRTDARVGDQVPVVNPGEIQ